jgi:hypothetical protein
VPGCGLILACALAPLAPAQDKKPTKKDPPQVIMASPLGAAPGVATRVVVRGARLDAATGIRFPNVKATAKLLSKGPARLPRPEDAGRLGNTQVEVEVVLPAGLPAGTVGFVVTTAAGDSAPHRLLVEDPRRLVPEKEPNNGFRQAQPIALPCTVEGRIDPARDVDVFRFDGRAGQRVRFEILAARFGSALDSILTLYDAGGHELAANDDSGGSADSVLEATLPQAGTYYLSLMDAHDQGGRRTRTG